MYSPLGSIAASVSAARASIVGGQKHSPVLVSQVSSALQPAFVEHPQYPGTLPERG